MGDKKTTIIKKKLYLINNLRTNILIENNIFIPEKVSLNIIKSIIFFRAYGDIKIPLKIIIKSNKFIRRIIYFITTIIMPAKFYTAIFIEKFYGKNLLLL